MLAETPERVVLSERTSVSPIYVELVVASASTWEVDIFETGSAPGDVTAVDRMLLPSAWLFWRPRPVLSAVLDIVDDLTVVWTYGWTVGVWRGGTDEGSSLGYVVTGEFCCLFSVLWMVRSAVEGELGSPDTVVSVGLVYSSSNVVGNVFGGEVTCSEPEVTNY